ncbi:hypothetical protein B484DRAFT_458734, partial [Ochromonadaceae sp. CCMP2298]
GGSGGSAAALLYALAGEQGDSESVLQLGWMFYYGEGVPRSEVGAEALFGAALRLERGEDAVEADAIVGGADAGAHVGEGGDIGGGGGGQTHVTIDHSKTASSSSEKNPHPAPTPADDLLSQSLLSQSQQRFRHSYAPKNTGGAAPLLALAVLWTDRLLREAGMGSVRTMWASVLTLGEAGTTWGRWGNHWQWLWGGDKDSEAPDPAPAPEPTYTSAVTGGAGGAKVRRVRRVPKVRDPWLSLYEAGRGVLGGIGGMGVLVSLLGVLLGLGEDMDAEAEGMLGFAETIFLVLVMLLCSLVLGLMWRRDRFLRD